MFVFSGLTPMLPLTNNHLQNTCESLFELLIDFASRALLKYMENVTSINISCLGLSHESGKITTTESQRQERRGP